MKTIPLVEVSILIFVVIANVTLFKLPGQVKEREKSMADIKCSGQPFLKKWNKKNEILSQTLQTGKNEQSHGETETKPLKQPKRTKWNEITETREPVIIIES